MYFRLQQKERLLRIDDTFAHLRTIHDNGDLEFEFVYSLSQSTIVMRHAQCVNVTLMSRNVSKKQMATGKRGVQNVSTLTMDIRSAMIDAKTAASQRTEYEVIVQNSDTTAFVNNEAIPRLQKGVPVETIQAFNRSKLHLSSAKSIKETNENKPLLRRVANTHVVPNIQTTLSASVSTSMQTQRLMYDMIVRQGLDPSYIVDLEPRVASERLTLGGILIPDGPQEKITDPATQLLNSHLFPTTSNVPPSTTSDLADSENVQVLKVVTDDSVLIPVNIVIPIKKLQLEGTELSQLFVRFDLIDSKTKRPIDSVTKTLNVAKHIQIFETPKKPPLVQVSTSSASSHATLVIKQIDPGAGSVSVYKKSIWSTSSEVSGYTLIGTYDLTTSDQPLSVYVDRPSESPVLYRVVSRGKHGVDGFEYNNVVVQPPRYVPLKQATLTASPIDIGIRLELRKLLTNATSVQLNRWNMTTHEKDSTIVASGIRLIDDATRALDMISIVDSAARPGHTYRYTARFVLRTGEHVDVGDCVIEFVAPAPGQVDTRVNDLIIDQDSVPNVRFNIETVIVDSDIDAVKNMLNAQDLQQFFQDDLQTQRDQLKKLIAHSVHRVDLTTGQRSDFGILSTAQFNDDALRKTQVIEPLVNGHQYRYEIYPLLRSAETMFTEFQKQAVDPVTKKAYSYAPAKFHHPLTLTRGVLVSQTGARQRYAKDSMSYGAIGSMSTVEVSLDKSVIKLIEANAIVFDRRLNVVTWQVLGDGQNIDHFLIVKQVHGYRTMLGKVRSGLVGDSYKYFHEVSADDVGAMSYVIIPIMSDYKVGTAVQTNELVVETI